MENETSIYNHIRDLCYQKWDLKHKLQRASEIIHDFNGTRMSFCEFFGPRWSFIAGYEDQTYPEVKEKITFKYGIVADNFHFSKEETVKLYDALRCLFEKH